MGKSWREILTNPSSHTAHVLGLTIFFLNIRPTLLSLNSVHERGNWIFSETSALTRREA
jgi:hypothetical protein